MSLLKINQPMVKMTETDLPEVVNEFTKICRICLNDADEFHSIQDFGKVCNVTVKISDLLSECTSIEVIIKTPTIKYISK